VGDRLATHRIQTRNGEVQVITLPWLTRSALLTRPETDGLSLAEVNYLLIDRLRVALEGEIRRLDPDLPTVLLGHLMTDTAQFGAERFLAVGKGFTVPMAMLTRPCFDYVALGHVHRHQVLAEQPFVVYPGSIERVDFSEEQEEKGFVLVELAKGQTQLSFCPLPVRPFRTIRVDLSQLAETADPQAQLLKVIQATEIQEAVVRVIYQVRSDQLDQIDSTAFHQSLLKAHSYTMQAELVSQLARPRLPELGTGHSVDPIDALKTYLEHQPHLSELSGEILAAALALLTQERLISERPEQDGQLNLDLPTAATAQPSAQPDSAQLRLL
jgi:DNA repair protein SbcD/Mre11